MGIVFPWATVLFKKKKGICRFTVLMMTVGSLISRTQRLSTKIQRNCVTAEEKGQL